MSALANRESSHAFMNLVHTENTSLLEEFGFRFDEGGTHLARTMMFDDLTKVFENCDDCPNKSDVVRTVDQENCLGKPSRTSRELSAKHLIRLYGFDGQQPIYRAMSYLWSRDVESRPLIAFLTAYARDAVLRSGVPFMQDLKDGEPYVRNKLEEFIEATWGDRFSETTKTAVAQRLAGTWTQSGHLVGRSKKHRQFLKPGPGAVVMALLLSYVTGHRGSLTFESEYVKLLDCSPATAIEQAKVAAKRGWLDVKHIGSVIEVAFPKILTKEEVEKIREQS